MGDRRPSSPKATGNTPEVGKSSAQRFCFPRKPTKTDAKPSTPRTKHLLFGLKYRKNPRGLMGQYGHRDVGNWCARSGWPKTKMTHSHMTFVSKEELDPPIGWLRYPRPTGACWAPCASGPHDTNQKGHRTASQEAPGSVLTRRIIHLLKPPKKGAIFPVVIRSPLKTNRGK